MSEQVLGFAEKVFSVDPRPSALSIEKFLSVLVLLDIVVQVVLIGFILTDDFTCATKDTEIPSNDYIALVCGTQIRSDAKLFYIEKILFLFLFLAIFYFNKIMVSRVSRYHCILMGERIERYLGSTPIYLNVNYHRRWTIAMVAFFLYKLIMLLLLSAIITAAFVTINEASAISDLFNFRGVKCGPEMKFVPDIKEEQRCHFDHEFLITVLSYITSAIAFLVLILFFLSFFTLLFYYYKFHNQKRRKEHIDEDLIGYELVNTKK